VDADEGKQKFIPREPIFMPSFDFSRKTEISLRWWLKRENKKGDGFLHRLFRLKN